MRKAAIPAVAFALAAIAATAFVQQFSYVGAQKCGPCHKTDAQGLQLSKWEASGHARAFAALNTPTAAQAGQAMGIEKPPDDPKCLKCHGPLAEKAPDLKAEGVSCEVCHGPGSDYKSVRLMMNRDEAAKNGLILYAGPEAVKAQCLGCHENAHGKTFDFAAAYEKIKHLIPEN